MENNDKRIISLTISMPNTNYCVWLTGIMKNHGCPDYAPVFTNINKTISNFIVSIGSGPTGVSWLAIGCQQWGATTSTTGNLTISYPIKFNVVHSLGGMTITSGNMTGSNQCLAVKSVTTSSFVSHMYDNARGFAGRYWCAIGC